MLSSRVMVILCADYSSGVKSIQFLYRSDAKSTRSLSACSL